MHEPKTALTLSFFICLAGVWAQTPPIRINTPEIPTPPKITVPGLTPGEVGGQPLTLQEAVAIALHKQPLILIAEAERKAAAGRTQQVRAGQFPTASLNAGISEVQSISGSSNNLNRYTASLSAEQLLFDFGRTRDLVRQQEALEKAANQNIAVTRNDVVLATQQAFFDLAQARQLETVSEQNVANRQRQLDLARARVEAGLGAPSDELQAKTNLADAVVSLTIARASSETARILLSQAMGVDVRTPIELAPNQVLLAPLRDLKESVDQAVNSRPDIQAALSRVNAARAGVQNAQKTNLPRVVANVSYGARGFDDPFTNQNTVIGVSVVWNFLDGGLTAGRTKEAKANVLSAEALLDQTTKRVVTEVTQAWLDLQTAQQREAIAQAQVANATQLIQIAEGRYAGGLGSFLEITDAQNALFAAQRNLLQAQNDVARASARLTHAVGAPG